MHSDMFSMLKSSINSVLPVSIVLSQVAVVTKSILPFVLGSLTPNNDEELGFRTFRRYVLSLSHTWRCMWTHLEHYNCVLPSRYFDDKVYTGSCSWLISNSEACSSNFQPQNFVLPAVKGSTLIRAKCVFRIS